MLSCEDMKINRLLLFCLMVSLPCLFTSCGEDDPNAPEPPVEQPTDEPEKPSDDSEEEKDNNESEGEENENEPATPEFHVYLCFGQSNMEGNAAIETQDRENVPERFRMMAAVDNPDMNRTKGEWYTAIPPLARRYTGLTPVDYFGRKMVEKLPEHITVGVINVAVAGCSIDLFDKDKYAAYLPNQADWLKNIANEYGGNPYNHLIELAKEAQKVGVIKGILMHQGETNTGDENWPDNVKKVYEDMLADLNLSAENVPLLVGEVVHANQGGVCAYHNVIISRVPSVIPTAHVISSDGCQAGPDNLHFSAEGYRVLGGRYADKMLSLLGIE